MIFHCYVSSPEGISQLQIIIQFVMLEKRILESASH